MVYKREAKPKASMVHGWLIKVIDNQWMPGGGTRLQLSHGHRSPILTPSGMWT